MMIRSLGRLIAWAACASLAVSSLPATSASGEGPARGGPRRAVIVDYRTPQNGPWRVPNAIALVDIDAGVILAEAEIGRDPDVALSSDGATLAVISHFRGGPGGFEEFQRLQLFSTSDLQLLGWGFLPFRDRMKAQITMGVNVAAFADGDRVLLVPRHPDAASNSRAGRWTPIDLQASMAKLAQGQLKDSKFLISSTYKSVVGGTGARFPILSTRRWPEVDVGFQGIGMITTLDFVQGKVVKETVYSGIEELRDVARETGAGPMSAGDSGAAIGTNEGNLVFFAPTAMKPAALRRIELDKGRPKVVKESLNVTSGLHPSISSGSERAGMVALACEKAPNQPSKKFRLYNTSTLEQVAEIDPGMGIKDLMFTLDGTRLCVFGDTDIKVYSTDNFQLISTHHGLYKEFAASIPVP